MALGLHRCLQEGSKVAEATQLMDRTTRDMTAIVSKQGPSVRRGSILARLYRVLAQDLDEGGDSDGATAARVLADAFDPGR